MNGNGTKKRRPPRQPLSIFGKTTATILFVHIALWVSLGIFIRQTALITMGAIELLVAALILLGIRWAPLLASVFGGLILYVFLFLSDFPLAHLSHPKDVYGAGQVPWIAFLMFTVILVIFWCAAMLVVAGVAAVIHNYVQQERRTPRWSKTALAGAIGILFGAFLLGAISQPAPATATNAGGAPTVHLLVGSFSQSSITLSKGAKLTLIDDGAYHHNISDGTWINGQPVFNAQSGEPVVKNQDINSAGTTLSIGPFNTAGTYHLMCSLHHGMVLTIIVQ